MNSTPTPPAGKETRNHTGSIVAAIALLVGWAVVAVNAELQHIDSLAEANAPMAAEQLVWLARIVAFGFSLGVLVVGAWIVWLGLRICRASEFPLPGMMLTRSMRVRTGRKARLIGWLTQFVGLLVLVLGTTTTWQFVQLAQMLLRS